MVRINVAAFKPGTTKIFPTSNKNDLLSMSTVERCSPHSPTPNIHGKDGPRHDALRPIRVIKRHGFFVMRLANKPPPNNQRVDFLDASTAHNSPVCWGRQEKSCTQQGSLVCKIFIVTALANSGRPALRVLDDALRRRQWWRSRTMPPHHKNKL